MFTIRSGMLVAAGLLIGTAAAALDLVTEDDPPHNMMLGAVVVDRVRIRGVSCLRRESVYLPSVYTYTDLAKDEHALAHLEATEDEKVVIAKAGNRVHVVIDMSGLPPPRINCIPGGVLEFKFDRPTHAPNFKVLGSPEHAVEITGIDFSVDVVGLNAYIPC